MSKHVLITETWTCDFCNHAQTVTNPSDDHVHTEFLNKWHECAITIPPLATKVSALMCSGCATLFGGLAGGNPDWKTNPTFQDILDRYSKLYLFIKHNDLIKKGAGC